MFMYNYNIQGLRSKRNWGVQTTQYTVHEHVSKLEQGTSRIYRSQGSGIQKSSRVENTKSRVSGEPQTLHVAPAGSRKSRLECQSPPRRIRAKSMGKTTRRMSHRGGVVRRRGADGEEEPTIARLLGGLPHALYCCDRLFVSTRSNSRSRYAPARIQAASHPQ